MIPDSFLQSLKEMSMILLTLFREVEVRYKSTIDGIQDGIYLSHLSDW